MFAVSRDYFIHLINLIFFLFIFLFLGIAQAEDITPPLIFSTTVTYTSDTTAIITWKTDENADSRAEYGETPSLELSPIASAEFVTNHAITLFGLDPSTTYYFRVGSLDESANGPTYSFTYSFTTDDFPYIQAPVITTPPTVTNITGTTATIEWDTDEPSDSQVHYGFISATWEAMPHIEYNGEISQHHSVTLTGLLGQTRYYFLVGSSDVEGNGPETSLDDNNPFTQSSFTTILAPSPPQYFKLLSSNGIDFTFTWNANHYSDQVVVYKIYWTSISQIYNLTDRVTVLVSELPDADNPSLSIMLPEVPNPVYFSIKAENMNGFESDFSNELSFNNPAESTPPDRPQNKAPDDEAVISYGNPVSLQASDYYDPDGDNHIETIWNIQRTDTGLFIDTDYPFTDSGLTSHTITSTIDEGLKYDWQVAYVDTDGIPSWSQVYSFKIGELVQERLPEIPAGERFEDFKMISIVHWPDDPEPQAVFNIDYKPAYCRIGTYDPGSRRYIEFGGGLEMEPGKAYWVLTRDKLMVDFQGVPVNSAKDIIVRLNVNSETGHGWNQIAPPNKFEYLWKKIKVGRFVDGHPEYTVDPIRVMDPGADLLIDKRTWEWADGIYSSYRPGDGFNLEPYKGYWVKALQNGVYLVFPVDGRIAGLATPENTMLTFKGKMLHWANKILPSVREAIAGDDFPPMPMGGLKADENPLLEGCFIQGARD